MKLKTVQFVLLSAIAFTFANCLIYRVVAWHEVQSTTLMLMPILSLLIIGIIPSFFNKRILTLCVLGASTIGLCLFFRDSDMYYFQSLHISDPAILFPVIGGIIGGGIELQRSKKERAR